MQDPPNPAPPVTAAATPLSGARCAQHPELPANAVCARCGNFMCATCSEQGQSKHCGDCRARPDASDFPFSRERYTLEGLIDFTFKRWKANWLTLSLGALIFLGITYGLVFIGAFVGGVMMQLGAHGGEPRTAASFGLQAGVQIVQIFVQIWLQLGLFAMLIDVLKGREPNLGIVFSRSGKILSALGQFLLIYLGFIVLLLPFAAIFLVSDKSLQLKVGLGIALLELIPFVYFGVGVVFSQIELAYNPEAGAISALRTSFALVNGQRWKVLGMGLAAGAITFAGALACCVGMIPAMSLGMMLMCALFLTLRTQTG